MELDLLGLGLPPATDAAVGHGGSAGQRPDFEKAGSDEAPLRLAAAATEAPSPARGRMRRRPVYADDGDVAAPPANRLKPPSTAPSWPPHPPSSSRKVRVPGAAGDRSPRASQLGFFRGMFPPAMGDLAAAGQAAQVHAIATSSPPPPLGVSALTANGFGRPPPFAAGPMFEGSAAASSSSDPDHPTAPLTIIYAGSVRAFDSVPVEQAEKILLTTAKEAQAAETPAFQQPTEPAAAIPSSSAAQMMMLLGLANANDSLLPKRTASLARFLHRRKQRVERAAPMPMPYPCGEVLPAQQMDPSTGSYARDIEQPRASEDGPKSMKENHGEEVVNTDLKI